MSNLVERAADTARDSRNLDGETVIILELIDEVDLLTARLRRTVTTKYHDDLMQDWKVIDVAKDKRIDNLTHNLRVETEARDRFYTELKEASVVIAKLREPLARDMELLAEDARLTARIKVLESDDHEWYLQAKEIERLTAELEADWEAYKISKDIWTARIKVLEDGLFKIASPMDPITIGEAQAIAYAAIAAADKESI